MFFCYSSPKNNQNISWNVSFSSILLSLGSLNSPSIFLNL